MYLEYLGQLYFVLTDNDVSFTVVSNVLAGICRGNIQSVLGIEHDI